jgi:hypothetical protein
MTLNSNRASWRPGWALSPRHVRVFNRWRSSVRLVYMFRPLVHRNTQWPPSKFAPTSNN